MCMGIISITITNNAYNFLRFIKGEKSFSETILRISRSNDDIPKFAGVFRDANTKSIEHVREKINKD